nr:hypothetical protein CFP56_48262 [Quercus suber]
MLEPSHYALDGPKALPYKSKVGSEIHPSRSFADTVKASVQGRKYLYQPSNIETKKSQVVENTLLPPRDEAGIQVVALEVPSDNAIPIAVGGGEGSHRGINADAKFEEKIQEQNKFRLKNLNLKDVDSGRERLIRRSSWLRKGLTVEINEFGKRRVSWQRYRSVKQAVKWVAREDNSAQVVNKGIDNGPWLGKCGLGPLLSGPFVFEAGACSKQPLNKPSPVITGLNVEDGNLESKTTGLSISLNGESATVLPASSGFDSQSPRKKAVAPMGSVGSSSPMLAPEVIVGSGSCDQVSSSCITQSLNMPMLTAEVVQAVGELGSSSLAPICPLQELAEMTVKYSGVPVEKMAEKSSSPVARKDEDDELLGPERPGEPELPYPVPYRADIDSGSGPSCMRAGSIIFSSDMPVVGAGGVLFRGPNRKNGGEVAGGDEG